MIAVTGANGDLGIRLLKTLKASGPTRIRALVRSEPARKRVQNELVSGVDIQIVDYRNVDSFSRGIAGCSAIVNLVGTIYGSKGSPYQGANEDVVDNLLKSARNLTDPYIIQVSIVGANEKSNNDCLSSRGRSDAKLLQTWKKSLILRAPMVLFPGGPSALALRRRANGWEFWMGNGSNLEQPLDDRDLFSAIEKAISRPSVLRGDYDLVGPETVRYSELVARAAEFLNTKPRPIIIPSSLIRFVALLGEKLFENPPITKDMIDIFLYNSHHDSSPLCKALELKLRDLDATLEYSLSEETNYS
tara:strand:+ start:5862 stop:6770 length:909 start_codon:yes stop_codon:yes gene_type:complete